ncbi:nucleotidyltransferase family protein [Roseomonas sp. CCTCC AB2023176]|uniref:nucleotidyltransferase family protein n=1 Tax=Roseomonas sp. CCTCC AB2023176 TaxID=3342640 RepID=UPI0035DBBC9A
MNVTLPFPLDLEAVAALCRRYHVKRLDVFGSAVAGDFDPDRSDLDLLVEFEDVPEAKGCRPYADLLFSLEDLAGRRVDLVESGAVKNRYVLKQMQAQRQPLYPSRR